MLPTIPGHVWAAEYLIQQGLAYMTILPQRKPKLHGTLTGRKGLQIQIQECGGELAAFRDMGTASSPMGHILRARLTCLALT